MLTKTALLWRGRVVQGILGKKTPALLPGKVDESRGVGTDTVLFRGLSATRLCLYYRGGGGVGAVGGLFHYT